MTLLISDWFGCPVRLSILPKKTARYSVCEERDWASDVERGDSDLVREVERGEGGEGDLEEGDLDLGDSGEEGLEGSSRIFRDSSG